MENLRFLWKLTVSGVKSGYCNEIGREGVIIGLGIGKRFSSKTQTNLYEMR